MSRFGPIIQNGYVVRDWREAARHWVEVLGVGPFFTMEHIEFSRCLYRGEPIDLDMSVAIAYSGATQIELVQQHNSVNSIYSDYLAAAPEGLHHVGVLTDRFDQLLGDEDVKARLVQHGETVAGQRFAYLDTIAHGGTMVELIEANEQIIGAFEYMQQAAAQWDGRDPIR